MYLPNAVASHAPFSTHLTYNAIVVNCPAIRFDFNITLLLHDYSLISDLENLFSNAQSRDEYYAKSHLYLSNKCGDIASYEIGINHRPI